MTMHSLVPALLLLTAVTDVVLAQANTVPGLNIRLENTSQLARYRRTGTYPNGVQAMGMYTTCCNPGSVPIPFQAAMNPNHGFIHYIVARESNGRFVQISNYSWVKHTFGSNNLASSCGTCPLPGTTSFVVPGCNDTYANTQAVDHFNLASPDEVDPWLGTWNPIGSYFDRGNPDVGFPGNQDGVRSLTQQQAGVLNQSIGQALRVHDDDLVVPGSTFWYQSSYLVPGELEALRGDNMGSRQFTPTWSTSSSQWNLSNGTNYLIGSVLQRWSGASVDSAANGTDDGRYYVAVKVTGPVNGLWHYEYAVQNRDNKRGMGAFRIPNCAEAQVLNFGFRDVDRNPLTDWTGAKVGNEVVFQTGSVNANPLKWNCIYNFWFDSDAAPITGNVLLDQYAIGPGALTVNVPSTLPGGVYNQNLGAGCGLPAAPSLFAAGTPARALLGNATLALRSEGNPANVPCAFLLSTAPGTTALGGGCTAYTQNVATLLGPLVAIANGAGIATIPLAVPNDPAMEGQVFDFQMLNVQAGGALFGAFNASNGLRVRVGNLVTACP